ncbi:unnamed protein product, partial [Iphiclides podalirius]
MNTFCQVIANSPYYANSVANGGLAMSNAMPVVNALAGSSPVNTIIGNGLAQTNLAMANALPAGPVHSAMPGEAAINSAAAAAIAANAANALSAGVTGLESFSLGGVPMSGVSPMGYGDVAVIGELPVGGSTALAGNVPVIGYVTFEGTVPAGGTVTLASNCGCSSPTVY